MNNHESIVGSLIHPPNVICFNVIASKIFLQLVCIKWTMRSSIIKFVDGIWQEHYQSISSVLLQQYQTTSYKRAVWYADSEGDMNISITTTEEVSFITLISSARRSISMNVCNFIRKAVYAVITYCSKRDSFWEAV